MKAALSWRGLNYSGSSLTRNLMTSSGRASRPAIAVDLRRLGEANLTAKHVRVVALDRPTSWTMATKSADEFTAGRFEAINAVLLDMLAAVRRALG